MTAEEQAHLTYGLSEIIDRLATLKTQPASSFSRWPEISAWWDSALIYIKTAIDIFIRQCESLISSLPDVSRDYDQWTNSLNDLWKRLGILRVCHNRWFQYDYQSVLYHHIFINEMLNCLPARLSGARSKFIVAPTGELIMIPINEWLGTLGPDWFDEEYLTEFDTLAQEDPVICFECHREQNYERQAILGHEIFHIIVRRNPILVSTFTTLANDPTVKQALNSNVIEDLISQLEELFCDYAASWFFGPIFLKAFTDEIIYYTRPVAPTHPSNKIRSEFLFVQNVRFKNHRCFADLKKYMELHDGTTVTLNQRQAYKKMKNVFKRTLSASQLNQYVHSESKDFIQSSFNLNIPYVADDVRILLNNLPLEGDLERPENYSALISESLRKTHILRQIKKYVREPDSLFAVPSAL